MKPTKFVTSTKQNTLPLLPPNRFFCHPDSGWSCDQPQPGSFFQRPREAEKRDPGNEVDDAVNGETNDEEKNNDTEKDDSDVEDLSKTDSDDNDDDENDDNSDDDDGKNKNRHNRRKSRKKSEDEYGADDDDDSKSDDDNDDNDRDSSNTRKKNITPVVNLKDESLDDGMGSEISFVSKHGPAKFYWLKGGGKGSTNHTEM